MTLPTVAPHTAAMLTRLATTTMPVGDGRKPDGRDDTTLGGWQGNPGESVFKTYVVLYTLNVRREGDNASLANRFTDPELHYQVTTIGVDRASCEAGQDLVAGALLNGTPLTISGRTQLLLTHESSVGPMPDEDVSPVVFFAVDRYRLDSTT